MVQEVRKRRFVFARDQMGALMMSREHFKWLLASDKYTNLGAMKPSQLESFC